MLYVKVITFLVLLTSSSFAQCPLDLDLNYTVAVHCQSYRPKSDSSCDNQLIHFKVNNHQDRYMIRFNPNTISRIENYTFQVNLLRNYCSLSEIGISNVLNSPSSCTDVDYINDSVTFSQCSGPPIRIEGASIIVFLPEYQYGIGGNSDAKAPNKTQSASPPTVYIVILDPRKLRR